MPNSDFSSTVPWSGVIGLPDYLKRAPLKSMFKWTPGSIPSGGSASTTIGLAGLAFGMPVSAIAPYSLKGCGLSASVWKPGVAEVVVVNLTGGTAVLHTGTWTVWATSI